VIRLVDRPTVGRHLESDVMVGEQRYELAALVEPESEQQRLALDDVHGEAVSGTHVGVVERLNREGD
jgi:hypothetical protein